MPRSKKHVGNIRTDSIGFASRAFVLQALVKIIIILFTGIHRAHAGMPVGDLNKVADAIYRIEGGTNTRYPYGISIIKTQNKAEARQICLNTIEHKYRDWQAKYADENFFKYLARKYCPLGPNKWYRNIRSVLGADFISRYDKPP